MLENITINDILKYYNGIDSDKLSENNINIDENLEVEDSFGKYLQLFASFLNEAYYRGYIISESILKKLMDIIEYEGFEYQIMEAYSQILLDAMNDYHCDDNNRPIYREYILSTEDSRKFINEYLEAIKIISTDKYVIPFFKNPESTEESKVFSLRLLNEVEYPIDYIFKHVLEKPTIEAVYMIYKNNLSAYKALINKFNRKEFLFFLLDESDNESLDILIENTSSVSELAITIGILYSFINLNHVEPNYTLSNTINNNIRRLFELLTINVTNEQTAMIVGTNYDIWKRFDDNNPHSLVTLTTALNLYDTNPEKYTLVQGYALIPMIRLCYKDDAYFYARQFLLNMNYKILCDNFIEIYEELKDQIDHNRLFLLFGECIAGLSLHKNDIINEALDSLCTNLITKESSLSKQAVEWLTNAIKVNIKSTN